MDWITAFSAGVLLAFMLNCNALLAKHTSPVFASWTAHGLGAAAGLLLVALQARRGKPAAPAAAKPPRWAYWGGLPGALTVVLAGITVNSRLALPGTVAFMLAGQVVFGLASDGLGLFGVAKKRIGTLDLAAGFTILAGSTLIIFGGR